MEKVYVVIPTDDIVQEMIEESCHNGPTFRRSLDGNLSILKFCNPFPNTMGGREKKTRIEIMAYLVDNAADWELMEE